MVSAHGANGDRRGAVGRGGIAAQPEFPNVFSPGDAAEFLMIARPYDYFRMYRVTWGFARAAGDGSKVTGPMLYPETKFMKAVNVSCNSDRRAIRENFIFIRIETARSFISFFFVEGHNCWICLFRVNLRLVSPKRRPYLGRRVEYVKYARWEGSRLSATLQRGEFRSFDT